MEDQTRAFQLKRQPDRFPLHRRERGFTLVELIATVIILGILAALIVPRYSSIVDIITGVTSEAAASEAVTRLQGATQLYTVDTGKPPKALDDIASARYLGLGAGNKVRIGSYNVAYAQDSANHEVTITVSSAGDTANLANATISWP